MNREGGKLFQNKKTGNTEFNQRIDLVLQHSGCPLDVGVHPYCALKPEPAITFSRGWCSSSILNLKYRQESHK